LVVLTLHQSLCQRIRAALLAAGARNWELGEAKTLADLLDKPEFVNPIAEVVMERLNEAGRQER
jgi:hypothetical protein